MSSSIANEPLSVKRPHPFRRAVLRGVGVVLPPLLTVVIVLWVLSLVDVYVMQPVRSYAEWGIARSINRSREFTDIAQTDNLVHRDGRTWHRLPPKADGKPNRQWVPAEIYDEVTRSDDAELGPPPSSAHAFYRRYVALHYLQPQIVIPVFVCLFVLLMYMLGKFLAAGIGRFMWETFEKIIHRLPLIRNVYSSVKQVTDFVFSEKQLEFSRVVAVEYPRRGIWSFGFVTSESLLDIRDAAREPVLAVLIPTSPIPWAGFMVAVKKSEAIDLNLTLEQAFEFVISCGVVVPPQQLQHHLSNHGAPDSQTAPDDRDAGQPLAAPSLG